MHISTELQRGRGWQRVVLVLITSATVFSGVTLAQTSMASDDMAQGVVRKVDKDARKITIKHGEIRSLEMPPMTMVFQVRNLTLLERVKAGDNVLFKAANDKGVLVVTEIQTVK
ncbi:MAG: hypothetical protein D4R79_09535 [Comamonadaceae bacterium]|nr:MAG: hypothetical protein D4R79_09535 [Comamonadaceae bacterium]